MTTTTFEVYWELALTEQIIASWDDDEMIEYIELHDLAMELSDAAFIAKRAGDIEHANHLMRQAFQLEAIAADMVRNAPEIEPTRSVLYRSAASMAIDIGELHEAEKLITIALDGNPPSDIADQLRHLLEQVQLHLLCTPVYPLV